MRRRHPYLSKEGTEPLYSCGFSDENLRALKTASDEHVGERLHSRILPKTYQRASSYLPEGCIVRTHPHSCDIWKEFVAENIQEVTLKK
jgi:hypothetical protein